MDVQAVVFSSLGGLALFLFGMQKMSEGLRNIGSKSFKQALNSLTRNRFSAVFIGMGITCFIQSSSATSVMAVGFANAGLLAMEQAIAVVLGADIGTTVTAWIVSALGIGSFKITTYALPVIAIGFLVLTIGRRRRTRMIGQTLFGFGILFLGLGTMSDGVKSIKESTMIMHLFAEFGANPLLGIAAGTVATMVVQSSSATIAIIQVMAFQGVFGLEAALPLMFGADIGTTITAQLAALGGTRSARGVAMANSLFKLFGVALFVPLYLFGWYEDAVRYFIPDVVSGETGNNTRIMAQIAIAHTAYIAVNVAIFSTVLWPLLVKFSRRLTKLVMRSDDDDEDIIYLDPLLLDTPSVAIDRCVHQLGYMTRQCRKNITLAFGAFLDGDLSHSRSIAEREDKIDTLQTDITSFLVQLSRRELDGQISRAIPLLIHCINDAERIGDLAENLVELTESKVDNSLAMSADGQRDLRGYFDLVDAQFEAVLLALHERGGDGVRRAIELEDQINSRYVVVSENHVRRLEEGVCSIPAGVVFLDMAGNLEKIGDHLTNIADRIQLNNSRLDRDDVETREEDRIGR